MSKYQRELEKYRQAMSKSRSSNDSGNSQFERSGNIELDNYRRMMSEIPQAQDKRLGNMFVGIDKDAMGYDQQYGDLVRNWTASANYSEENKYFARNKAKQGVWELDRYAEYARQQGIKNLGQRWWELKQYYKDALDAMEQHGKYIPDERDYQLIQQVIQPEQQKPALKDDLLPSYVPGTSENGNIPLHDPGNPSEKVPLTNEDWKQKLLKTPGGAMEFYERLNNPNREIPVGSGGDTSFADFVKEHGGNTPKVYTPGVYAQEAAGIKGQSPVGAVTDLYKSINEENKDMLTNTPGGLGGIGYMERRIETAKTVPGMGKYPVLQMSPDEVSKAFYTEKAAIESGGGDPLLFKNLGDYYYHNTVQGARDYETVLDERIVRLEEEYRKSMADNLTLRSEGGFKRTQDMSPDELARIGAANETVRQNEQALELAKAEKKIIPIKIKALQSRELSAELRKDPDFIAKTFFEKGKGFDAVLGEIKGKGFIERTRRMANSEKEFLYQYLSGKLVESSYSGDDKIDYDNAKTAVGIDMRGLDRMTQEEKQNYLYLVNDGREDEAKAYLNNLSEVLLYRRATANKKDWKEYASKNGWTTAWTTIKSIPMTLANAALFPSRVLDTAMGGSPYGAIWDLQREHGAYRQVGAEKMKGLIDYNIPGLNTNLGEIVYDVATSLGDMLASAGVSKLLGAQSLTTVILGSSVASSTAYNALLEGKSGTQAVVQGLGAGVIEYLTERISWDSLVKMNQNQLKGLARSITKDIFKQTVTEGMEEGISNVANVVLSYLMYGLEGSEIGKVMDEVRNDASENGEELTDEQVKTRALIRMLQGAGADMLAGALSGGINAGGTMLLSTSARASFFGEYAGKQYEAASSYVDTAAKEGKPVEPSKRDLRPASEMTAAERMAEVSELSKETRKGADNMSHQEKVDFVARMRELTDMTTLRNDNQVKPDDVREMHETKTQIEAENPDITAEIEARSPTPTRSEQLSNPLMADPDTPQSEVRPPVKKAPINENTAEETKAEKPVSEPAKPTDSELVKAFLEAKENGRKANLEGIETEEPFIVLDENSEELEPLRQEAERLKEERERALDEYIKAGPQANYTEYMLPADSMYKRTLGKIKNAPISTAMKAYEAAADADERLGLYKDNIDLAVFQMEANRANGTASLDSVKRAMADFQKAQKIIEKNPDITTGELLNAMIDTGSTFDYSIGGEKLTTTKDGTQTASNGADIKTSDDEGKPLAPVFELPAKKTKPAEETRVEHEKPIERPATAKQQTDVETEMGRELAYVSGKLGLGDILVKNASAGKSLDADTAKALIEKGQAESAAALEQAKAKSGQLMDAMPRRGEGRVTFVDGWNKNKGMTSEQREIARLMSNFGKVMGFDIKLFSSKTDADGKFIGKNGSFDTRTGEMWLDINAGARNISEIIQASMPSTLAHELTHYLKAAVPDMFVEYQKAVLEQLVAKGENLDALIERQIRLSGGGISIETAIEEVVADASSMMLKDSTAMQQIADNNPGLFKTILDWLQQFMERIRRNMSKLNRNAPGAQALMEMHDGVQKVMKEFLTMYDGMMVEADRRRAAREAEASKPATERQEAPRAAVEHAEAQTPAREQTTAKTDVDENKGLEQSNAQEQAASERFSVRELPDGQMYVFVTRDQRLFDNAEQSEYGKIARRYIIGNFSGKVLGNRNKAYVRNDSANEFTYPANRRLKDDVLSAKRRASTELDNLIEAGKFLRSEPDDGRHPDATRGWDYYQVIYQVGNRFFEGETQIKKIERGDVFYDITKIRDITPSFAAKYGKNPQYRDHGDVSMNSIPSFGADSQDVRNSLRDQDEAYLSAVESGDMETAQKMVDEAAKAAGYTVKAYHGTDAEFTEFKRYAVKHGLNLGDGFYFTTDKDRAATYGKRLISAYLRVENPFSPWDIKQNETLFSAKDKDAAYKYFTEKQKEAEEKAPGYSRFKPSVINDGDGFIILTPLSYQYEANDGNDAVIFGDEIAVESPEQIKSADPVTYDDQGNIIPLSERFNKGNEDIRYDRRDVESEFSEDDVSYETLVQKPDMRLTNLSDDALKSRREIVNTGYQNAIDNGRIGERGMPAVYVKDIGREVHLSKSALDHPLDRRIETQAPVIQNIGEVLKNSILINVADAKNQHAEYSYFLLGAGVADSGEVFYASFAVNKFSNEIENIDLLYAPYTKQRSDRANYPGASAQNALSPAASEISISSLLNDVKDLFSDRLSDSVLKHFGVSRPSNSKITGLRFDQRETMIDGTPTPRGILAGAFGAVAKTAGEKKAVASYRTQVDLFDRIDNLLIDKQAELRELRKNRAPAEQIREVQAEVDALSRKLDSADRILISLQNSKPIREVLKREKDNVTRAMREKAAGERREYRAEYRAKTKERIDVKTGRGKVQQLANEMITWINSPDVKRGKYVPKVLQADLIGLLENIDQSSKRSLKGGQATQNDRVFIDRLTALRERLAKLNAYNNGTEALAAEYADAVGYIDLPNGFQENMVNIIDHVKALSEKLNGADLVINRMDSEHLDSLYTILKSLKKSLTIANQLSRTKHFETVAKAGQSSMEEMGQIKSQANKNGKAHAFMNWENTLPYYAMKRMGKATQAIFESFQDGLSKLAFHAKEVIAFSEKTYTEKELKDWTTQVLSVELNGQTVQMTPAHLMSIYCLSKREQAIGHLKGEGFRIGNFKVGRKSYADNTGHPLSDADIGKLTSLLTARQIEVADKLQRYMNTQGSKWGNEISMERFDVDLFGEENYFPIKADPERLTAKPDESAEGNPLYRLLNLSMTKSLVKNANNRIQISSIFDVFANHMSDMAQYNALAMPVLDAVKWFNYSEKQTNDDGTKSLSSVRDSIRAAWITPACAGNSGCVHSAVK